MDEETIMKAGLIAAVACRVVDYYIAAKVGSEQIVNTPVGKNSQPQLSKIADMQSAAETRLAVALENLLDAGLE